MSIKQHLQPYYKIKTISYITVSSFIFFITGILYFLILSYPVSMQKVLSFKTEDKTPSIFLKNSKSVPISYLKSQIHNIPYKKVPNTIYNVLPKTKYQRSIIEGDGNCSNLTFGAIYKLSKDNYGATTLYLLPKDLSFLKGQGHTVALVKSNNDLSHIVDYFKGGIPLGNNTILNLNNINNKNLNYSYIFFNEKRIEYNEGFQNNNKNDYYTGIMIQSEIIKYFKFIESIYFDTKLPTKFEKLLFDSISLFLGVTPNIYVKPELMTRIKKYFFIDHYMAYLTKISFIIFIISLFIISTIVLITFLKKLKIIIINSNHFYQVRHQQKK